VLLWRVIFFNLIDVNKTAAPITSEQIRDDINERSCRRYIILEVVARDC